METFKVNKDFPTVSLPAKNPKDPADQFPKPLFQQCILLRLEGSEHIKASLVSTKWKKLMVPVLDKEMDRRIAEVTIGPDCWEKYIGNVSKAPSMPEAMKKFMKSDCPYHPGTGKKVFETHTAVWIPKDVEGKSLTIKTMGEFVKKPKNGGNNTHYHDVWNEVNIDDSIEESYWILMTNDVVPLTENETFTKQKEFIGKEYEVPSTLEAIITVFMTYVCSEEKKVCHYGRKPWTFSRCKEEINGCRIIVGGFDSFLGLDVRENSRDSILVGLGALRKF